MLIEDLLRCRLCVDLRDFPGLVIATYARSYLLEGRLRRSPNEDDHHSNHPENQTDHVQPPSHSEALSPPTLPDPVPFFECIDVVQPPHQCREAAEQCDASR